MVKLLFCIMGLFLGVALTMTYTSQQPSSLVEESQAFKALQVKVAKRDARIVKLSSALNSKNNRLIKMSNIIDSLYVTGSENINFLEKVVYSEYGKLPDTVKTKYRDSVVQRLLRANEK